MGKKIMTEEVRKVAQQWPRKEITCKEVFNEVKKTFPGIKILTIQNLVSHEIKTFIPLRWERGDDGHKYRIYEIAHSKPDKRHYTTTLEIGESIYAVIEDRNEKIDNLRERIKDFSNLVEENKLLRERNQELSEEVAKAKGQYVPNKKIGLAT